MNLQLLNIGFGNSIVLSRVVTILTPGSAPMKRLKDEAKAAGRLVDATQGRKGRLLLRTVIMLFFQEFRPRQLPSGLTVRNR